VPKSKTSIPGDKMAFHVNEAAQVGGVSRSEIYEAMKRGELRAKKYGRRTIILRDDLAAFLCALPAYQPKAA